MFCLRPISTTKTRNGQDDDDGDLCSQQPCFSFGAGHVLICGLAFTHISMRLRTCRFSFSAATSRA